MNRTTRVLLASITAGLCVASTSAYAWNHFFTVWTPEQMPIPVNVADDGEPNSIEACEKSDGLSGCCEETVPAGYCYEATRIGFDTWADVPCTEIEVDVADGTRDSSVVAPNIAADISDGVNSVVFNDPGNQLIEASTYAAALFSNSAGQQAFVINGEQYFRHFGSVDIVFNNGIVFLTDEQLNSGEVTCSNEVNFQSVMTHEIGHFLGMAHTCERDEPCTDPLDLEATMYWGGRPCETESTGSAASLEEDDIDGITTLYGPSARFQCSHQTSDGQVIGVVPFDLKCVVVSDSISEITEASWTFGDGGRSDEIAATHRYDEPGNYTIQVSFRGDRPACGDEGWESDFRRVGYVRACGVPQASFEVEPVEGLSYKMLNDSDVSVFGCISDIQWDVFEGDSATGEPILPPIKSWEPIIDFPETGTYTVVMSLGGIAGTGGASATFEVSRTAGGNGVFNCNSVGAPAGGSALGVLLLAGLAALRRRQR